MATFTAMVAVQVEAETAEQARELFMEASCLVSVSDIGQVVCFEDEVDFDEHCR